MLQARLTLEAVQASLIRIAEQVGYNSEAAFSAAFKRHFGRSPGAYRRRRQARMDGAAAEWRRSS